MCRRMTGEFVHSASVNCRGGPSCRIVAGFKKNIQRKFKVELGLLLDNPKQRFRKSDDGNIARRSFSDLEFFLDCFTNRWSRCRIHLKVDSDI
ncbi:hypothetical protein AVEN_208898-1 [Araneus ventricosus]|uniref:Uncharacterized protein n=1 Tax=Araneus ventricosus TaxID=182803 RepID=A0A4Y2F2J1_ARAVE|nr:hypothetical protein AVEN_208898-1 [Araneus ventricosus]